MIRQDAFAAQFLLGAEPIVRIVPVLEAALDPVLDAPALQSDRAKFRCPAPFADVTVAGDGLLAWFCAALCALLAVVATFFVVFLTASVMGEILLGGMRKINLPFSL